MSTPTESGSAGPGHGASRIGPWDTLRILAFLDVVAFHVNDRHALLGVGLPTFLLLALALGARRRVPQATGEFVSLRIRRLLVPWLAWSAIYGLLHAARAVHHGTPLSEVFSPWMLLYGTEQHLWFLPFAVGAGVIVHLLDRLTQRLPLPVLMAGGLAAAAAAALLLVRVDLPYPLPQWGFGLASLPLGLVLGRLLARRGAEARAGWAVLLAVSVAGGLAVLARDGFQLPSTPPPAFRYALVAALLAGGALQPKLGDPWMPRLEPLLLGAYLAHPLVHELLVEPLYALTGHRQGDLVNLLVVAGLTFCLVAVLRRTPARAIL